MIPHRSDSLADPPRDPQAPVLRSGAAVEPKPGAPAQ